MIQACSSSREGFCGSLCQKVNSKRTPRILVTDTVAASVGHLPFVSTQTLHVSSSQPLLLLTDFHDKSLIYKLSDSHLKLSQISGRIKSRTVPSWQLWLWFAFSRGKHITQMFKNYLQSLLGVGGKAGKIRGYGTLLFLLCTTCFITLTRQNSKEATYDRLTLTE